MNLNIHETLQSLQTGLTTGELQIEDFRIQRIILEILTLENWNKLSNPEKNFLSFLNDKIITIVRKFSNQKLESFSNHMQTKIRSLTSSTSTTLMRRPSSINSQDTPTTELESTTTSPRSSKRSHTDTSEFDRCASSQYSPSSHSSSAATHNMQKRPISSRHSQEGAIDDIKENFERTTMPPVSTPPPTSSKEQISPPPIKPSPSKDEKGKQNPENNFRNAELRMSVFSKRSNLDLSDLELQTFPANLFTDSQYANTRLSLDKVLFMPHLNEEDIANKDLYKAALDAMLSNRAKLSDQEISNLLKLNELTTKEPRQKPKTLGMFAGLYFKTHTHTNIDDSDENLEVIPKNLRNRPIETLADIDSCLSLATQRIISCFKENSTHLNLNFLRVSYIPDELFDKLPQLRSINLMYNYLPEPEINKIKLRGIAVNVT